MQLTNHLDQKATTHSHSNVLFLHFVISITLKCSGSFITKLKRKNFQHEVVQKALLIVITVCQATHIHMITLIWQGPGRALRLFASITFHKLTNLCRGVGHFAI